MVDTPAIDPTESWSRELRRRFLEVARRRVPETEVEDLVQEAMTTVLSRSSEIEHARLVEGLPPIAWCFTVLRNTIGNYYQRRQRSRNDAGPEPLETLASGVDPAETFEQKELRARIHQAMRTLRSGDEQCWGFLSRLVDGAKPRRLAQDTGLEEAVLYRRLYRCRQKFRRLLEERGVRP